MDVHVFMRVHVIEPQPGCPKRVELRTYLHGELTANPRQKKEPKPGSRHVPIEPAFAADQVRYLGSRQSRKAVDKVEVQPDREARQTPRARYGITDCRTRDHQAGGRQNAVPVGLLDSLVDGGIEPEIVRADDQASQLAISRLRRNWKNSTPSRNRRRIISGLLTISATSEAILRRRK